jgi:tetratricopeptide (TPR) repeat protein
MPRPNALEAVLTGLSQAEESYLLQKLDKKNAAFLSAIRTKKTVLQQHLGPPFSLMTENSFGVMSSRFASEVASLRGEFRCIRFPLLQVREIELQAMGYQIAGQRSKAINLFSKAAQLAESMEAFDYAKNLWGEIVLMRDEDDPASTKYVEFRDANTLRHGQLVQMEMLILEIKPIKRLQEPKRREQAVHLLERLVALGEPQSLKAQLHFARIKGFCLILFAQHHEAVSLWDTIQLKLNNQATFSHETAVVQSVVAIHIALTSFNVGIGKAERSLALIDQLTNWLEVRAIEIPSIIHLEKARVIALEAWQRADFASFDRHATKLLKAFALEQFPNANRRLAVAIDLAEHYLQLQKPRKALQWIHRAYEDRNEEVIQENLVAGGMMEMTCWYLINDWDQLSLVVDNVGYLLKSRNQLNDYTKAVMKGFRAIVRNPFTAKETLSTLDHSLQEFDGNSAFAVLVGAFNMAGWIKKHLGT